MKIRESVFHELSDQNIQIGYKDRKNVIADKNYFD